MAFARCTVGGDGVALNTFWAHGWVSHEHHKHPQEHGGDGITWTKAGEPWTELDSWWISVHKSISAYP